MDRKPRVKRSKEWAKLRARFLKGKRCEACGTKERLEAHHVRPFHLFPESELDEKNLMALCEGRGCNCHLTFGHAGNWRAWNPTARRDAAAYRRIREERKWAA